MAQFGLYHAVLSLWWDFAAAMCGIAAAMCRYAAAMWFPVITWSQPNYSYGCFVVGVVVVVGLRQL